MPDLSAKQIAAIRDLLHRVSPTLGVALSEQLNREVIVDLLDVQAVMLAQLLSRSDSALQTQFTFSQPEGSDCVFVLSEDAARGLVALMNGQAVDEAAESLSEADLDTVSAAMSGLVRGFSTALTNVTGDMYDLEASSTHVGVLSVPPVFALEGSAVEVLLTVSIPGVFEANLSGLFTATFMSEVTQSPDGHSSLGAAGATDGLGGDDIAAMLSQAGGGDLGTGSLAPASSPLGIGTDTAGALSFGSLLSGSSETALPRGLDMILDIPLDVTVELGRVRMLIKDVLELSSGSIIELDRVAGEPVDLLVWASSRHLSRRRVPCDVACG